MEAGLGVKTFLKSFLKIQFSVFPFICSKIFRERWKILFLAICFALTDSFAEFVRVVQYFWVLNNQEFIYIYIYIYITFDILIRIFCNGPSEQGSIPGQVISQDQKTVLDASLLNTQNHKVRIKGKWSNPGKGVAPFPTPRCGSYWKWILKVAFELCLANLFMYRYMS